MCRKVFTFIRWDEAAAFLSKHPKALVMSRGKNIRIKCWVPTHK